MAETPLYGWPLPADTDLVKDLPAQFAAFAEAVEARYGVSARRGRTVDANIGNATDTDVAFSATSLGVTFHDDDPDRWAFTGSASPTLVVQPGTYRITCGIRWDNNGTGLRGLRLFADPDTGGSYELCGDLRTAVNAASGVQHVDSGPVRFDVETGIRARVRQTSGGGLAVQASTATFLAVELLR